MSKRSKRRNTSKKSTPRFETLPEVEAPAKENPPEFKAGRAAPRTRKIGQGLKCQVNGCTGDLFVTHTQRSNYPAFMKMPGIRRFRCGLCGNRTKAAFPIEITT